MINHFLDDSISGNMGAACTEEHFCINRTRSRYVRWVTCVGWRCKYEIVRVPTLRRVMRYKCIVTGERAICEETIYGLLDQVEDHQPPPGYLVFDALSLSLALLPANQFRLSISRSSNNRADDETRCSRSRYQPGSKDLLVSRGEA